jgi:hypothetical protein
LGWFDKDFRLLIERFFYQNALQSEREQDARPRGARKKFGLMASDCPNDTTQQDS